jgi:transcriptional regulator with XRE-family HTH domain
MSPTPKQMGKRIQALRKKQHLSRQELAAKARVSREYIRKLEAGQYDPAGTLRRIAKALGVPLAALLE